MLKPRIAEAVTNDFFSRHPDWVARYGDRGHLRGVEDVGYHLDFLAGALESGSVAAFEEYARWAARVLAARGIAPSFVAENLRQIAEALRPHLGADAWAAVDRTVTAGCLACVSAPPARADDAATDGADGLGLAQGVFLQAILRGERRAALGIALEALGTGRPVAEVYTRLFQASLYRVGALWEANALTVAEEHMATAITQHVIAQLYPHLPLVAPGRGRIVLAGVQGELHQVGAMMVADVLEADGWEVRFLGTNVPHDDIVRALADQRADLLALSATTLASLPRVRALVAAVRARFGLQGLPILGGGAAFQGLPANGEGLGLAAIVADLGGPPRPCRRRSTRGGRHDRGPLPLPGRQRPGGAGRRRFPRPSGAGGHGPRIPGAGNLRGGRR